MALALNALTPHCRRVLFLAIQKAEESGQHYVGTEHLVWALMTEPSGVADRVLDGLALRSVIAVRAAREITNFGPSDYSASNANDEVTIFIGPGESGHEFLRVKEN